MAKEIGQLNVKIALDAAGFQEGVSCLNREMRKVQSEFKLASAEMGKHGKELDGLKLKSDSLTKQTELQRQKVQALETAHKKSVEAKGADAKATQDLEIKLNQAKTQLVNMENSLKSVNKEIELQSSNWHKISQALEPMGQKMQDIGGKMESMGKDLSKKVTAPIVGAGAAALKMGSDFTDSIAKVSTLADTTQVNMEDLKAGILNISDATGIAAGEISESVYSALSAGIETADVLEYVEANVMLTKAGFTEMGTAIDATSTVLNAYGSAAFDVSKIGDILVKTQDEGKISVDELGKNIGRVIPTASSLGVNLDQLGASYAIMTAKGQNANIATTNLNSMLGELGKTGSKSDKALREVTEKSFRELTSEGKSVGDILGILDQHAQGAGLSLSDMFGSTTAGSAALTLLSDGVDGFNQKMDIMNNSTGTMAENFEKLKTPSEEMKIAINKIKNVMIELGEIILPILSSIAEWVSKAAEKFAGLDDGTKKTIIVIAGLAAAVGPLLIIGGKIIGAVGSIVGAFSTVSGAIAVATTGAAAATPAIGALAAVFTALTGPIGIAIAAVAGLTAVGVLLYKNWDTIKEKAGQLKDWLGEKWGNIKDSVSNSVEKMKGKWNEMSPAAKTAFTAVIGGPIAGLVQAGVQLYKNWDTVKEKISGAWEGIKTKTGEAINTLKSNIQAGWNNIKTNTSDAWNDVKTAVSNKWDEIKTAVSNKLTGVFNTLKSSFNNLKTIGRDMIVNVWEGMKSIWTSIQNWVADRVKWLTDKLMFWRRSSSEMGAAAVVGRNAAGTNFWQGGLTWVGELGPELVELPRGSKIHSNEKSMNMVRGESNLNNNLTIHIDNFNNNTDKDIEQLAYELEFYRQRFAMGRGRG